MKTPIIIFIFHFYLHETYYVLDSKSFKLGKVKIRKLFPHYIALFSICDGKLTVTKHYIMQLPFGECIIMFCLQSNSIL